MVLPMSLLELSVVKTGLQTGPWGKVPEASRLGLDRRHCLEAVCVQPLGVGLGGEEERKILLCLPVKLLEKGYLPLTEFPAILA